MSAFRSAGGVCVAVAASLIGYNAPCKSVSTLHSTSNGAVESADWLALSRLPASHFAPISGVGNIWWPRIGSAVLVVQLVCFSATPGRLLSEIIGRYPGLAVTERLRGGRSPFFFMLGLTNSSRIGSCISLCGLLLLVALPGS